MHAAAAAVCGAAPSAFAEQHEHHRQHKMFISSVTHDQYPTDAQHHAINVYGAWYRPFRVFYTRVLTHLDPNPLGLQLKLCVFSFIPS